MTNPPKRPLPPKGMRTKPPEPNSWLLAHKREAVLILIGAIFGLMFCVNVLADILVNSIVK